MEVTYTKGLFQNKIVTVSPEPDGTYILKGGTKYTIKAKCPNGKFTIEQDNWIYAPDGGLWSIIPFTNYWPMERMYIPSDKLIAAVQSQCKGWAGVRSNESIEDQVESVMRQLKLDDSAKALVESALSLTMTLAGGFGTVGAIIGSSKLVLAVAVAGDSYTIFSLSNDTSTIAEYFESADFRRACENGELNVEFIRWGYASLMNNLWDPWNSRGYINKYHYDDWNGYVRGTIRLNDSVQDVIDYCRF